MSPHELRRKYLDFFRSKGHVEHPSGSLIPYDVTGRLDESLLFNGAGMVQFKPYFRGVAEPEHPRLASSQKCLRTGDIDDVGDDSHLTFFEMLGNFSFGDYFKAEAIAYSWEFLTSAEWLGLDPRRLAFTVFEEDDEAHAEWSKHLSSVGIDPATRLFRLGEETNYWPAGAFSSGPPGPCGPNSEMFYWTGDGDPPSEQYSREDYLRDESEGRWLEIWNDVFIQYEWQGTLRDPARPDKGYEKLSMPELPFRSIDTGMGIERTIAVLGGHRSVYDTEAFAGLFRALEQIGAGRVKYGELEASTRAMRIIADHLRAASFCIADGVLPSNTGRGYVLRRLIRRAVVKGARTLGFDNLFIADLAQVVIEEYGSHYRELADRRETILETLRNEEALFRRTLAAGTEILADLLEPWRNGERVASTPLAGSLAFQLYDTYGFPLEVTQEICAEAGVSVDIEGYREAMEAAQERSRASAGMETVYGGVGVITLFAAQPERPSATEFLGYESTVADTRIVGAHAISEDGVASHDFVLALESTPFYAESGGQVGDTGMIYGEGFRLRVTDVTKQDGIYVHLVEPVEGFSPKGLPEADANADLLRIYFNQLVHAEVDASRRDAIRRNHTATHLLHAALRQVLGPHVTQAGSLVSDEVLRFDFTHGAAMTPEQIKEVEDIVYAAILESAAVVTYADCPIDEARTMGAMALFGEKYGDRVRVVQIGDMPPAEPSFSRELCGGTHVGTTGEIGMFKITHESSAASGVRRIVALTGRNAFDWVREQQELIEEAAAKLKARPREFVTAIDKLSEALREERKKRERLAQSGAGAPAAEEIEIGPFKFKSQILHDADASDAKNTADRFVDGDPNAVALIASIADGKVTFVCKVGSSALTQGAKAGDLVREVAKVAGGGGGGRPEFATAGGREIEKVPAAMARAREVLAAVAGR